MAESVVVATEFLVSECDKTKFKCEICCVSFSARGNLNKHLRKFHQLQVEGQGNQTCALCDEKFTTMTRLHQHIQDQHSVTLEFVDKTFYSEKDFLDWKNKIEKESLSSFVCRNSSQKVDSITTACYICHRSGHCKVKENRIRNLKSSGSIKMGTTCPAFMKVCTETIDGISEIKVQFQSVHLGHDSGTRSLRLNKVERENLAACLKLGIPMDNILEEARRNLSPTNRYSLLTRKHLHNIRRDFEIPMHNVKPPKVSAVQNVEVEMSDSSIGYEDCVEIEVSNHEEVQENEKTTAVSSLLLLQKLDYSEEFSNKKNQIMNQLKELQSRIEEWDPQHPLPDVEEHIKAINARLDICSPSFMASHVQGLLPVFPISPPNKPTTKRRRIVKPKKDSKKIRLN